MHEAPESGPVSTPPLSLRPHALRPVLRELRARLEPSPVVPLHPRSELEQEEVELDLLAHTPDCGPISEPPPAVRWRGQRR